MPWLDIFHWSTPRDRSIRVRLSDQSEVKARFHPLKQAWIDEQGNIIRPVVWWNEEHDDGK